MRSVALAAAALAALTAGYVVGIRPWYRSWGATREELRKVLPGDELWPRAAEVETRAITIDAPPERVWPWLAQLGQDKAGFYSYDWLEDLVGCEMPDERRILGLPDPRPGERLWMYPPQKAGGAGYATWARVERPRALVARTNAMGGARPDDMAEAGGTWGFVLEPRPDGRTRLLVRGRAGVAGAPEGLATRAFLLFVFDPVHFVMERRMMLRVKALAEGGEAGPAWRDAAEVVLWFATILFGLSAAAASLLRSRSAGRALGIATAALGVLTLLFFGRPPIALGLAVVIGLRVGASWAWRRGARAGSPPPRPGRAQGPPPPVAIAR